MLKINKANSVLISFISLEFIISYSRWLEIIGETESYILKFMVYVFIVLLKLNSIKLNKYFLFFFLFFFFHSINGLAHDFSIVTYFHDASYFIVLILLLNAFTIEEMDSFFQSRSWFVDFVILLPAIAILVSSNSLWVGARYADVIVLAGSLSTTLLIIIRRRNLISSIFLLSFFTLAQARSFFLTIFTRHLRPIYILIFIPLGIAYFDFISEKLLTFYVRDGLESGFNGLAPRFFELFHIIDQTNIRDLIIGRGFGSIILNPFYGILPNVDNEYYGAAHLVLSHLIFKFGIIGLILFTYLIAVAFNGFRNQDKLILICYLISSLGYARFGLHAYDLLITCYLYNMKQALK